MPWEADMIAGLQSALSNGFTDFVFGALTLLGDEIFVIAVMMLMFWCVSKRTGFKFLNVYFLTVAINTGIKSIVARPRPFQAYPDKVHSIGEESNGYSFPSGHTNSITTLATLTCAEYRTKLKILLPIAIVVVVLVMFTRLFLGQHYLTDVLSSAAIAVALSLVLGRLFELLGDHEERLGYVFGPLALIAAIVVGTVADGDLAEKTLQLTGVIIAVYIGYWLEKKYVRFDVRAALWQHVLKCLIGGVVALGMYLGLKYAFAFDTTYWLSGFVRFFLMGAWLSIGAPAVFKALKLYSAGERTAAED